MSSSTSTTKPRTRRCWTFSRSGGRASSRSCTATSSARLASTTGSSRACSRSSTCPNDGSAYGLMPTFTSRSLAATVGIDGRAGRAHTPSERASSSDARGARPTGASYDTVVIGAGLAGLTAALRLAEAGQRVAVLAKGVGATHLAPPTIDVLGFAEGPIDSPALALPEFAAANPQHPYRQLSFELLRGSLDWFKTRLSDQGYSGGRDEHFILPTAVGAAT